MKGLRDWQAHCIKKALKHYEKKKHFFCQATPAAGKTLMAAELANGLINHGKIDLIVCFAPTCQVVSSIQKTFERIIGRPMNGLVGAIGAAFTYSAMDHRDESFWELFDTYRIFAVFDEIHHCAGSEIGVGNSWGEKIIQKIQDRARFTLALSGTPWRSDERPIVLARYSEPDGQLICDFRYGLKEAIEHQVCRSPKIVLLDNGPIELLELKEASENRRFFSGIASLLCESSVTYEKLLHHDELSTRLIRLGISKLDEIRKKNVEAAGLIVATSIAHAYKIAHFLHKMGESYCVVNNQMSDAQSKIEEFRLGNCRWIVAVGMVSEGTDIQRLQVCCYLSRIRTELHYRQVLGRILRRKGKADAFAWFYALAEPTLKEYSNRIADDLPDDYGVVSYVSTEAQLKDVSTDDIFVGNDCSTITGDSTALRPFESGGDNLVEEVSIPATFKISFSQNYWHEVLSVY